MIICLCCCRSLSSPTRSPLPEKAEKESSEHIPTPCCQAAICFSCVEVSLWHNNKPTNSAEKPTSCRLLSPLSTVLHRRPISKPLLRRSTPLRSRPSLILPHQRTSSPVVDRVKGSGMYPLPPSTGYSCRNLPSV